MEEKEEIIVIEKKVRKITVKNLFKNVLDSLDLEKGLLFSVYSFVRHPGKAFHGYLHQDRFKHANPFKLALFATAIVVFLSLQFGLVENISKGFAESSGSEKLSQGEEAQIFTSLLKDYYNVFLLASVPILALTSFLFYKGIGYNYAEHLVLNTFLYTIITLLYIPLIFLTPFWSTAVYLLLSLSYQIWCYKSCFGKSVFRAFATALLGYFIYIIIAILFGGIIVGGMISASNG